MEFNVFVLQDKTNLLPGAKVYHVGNKPTTLDANRNGDIFLIQRPGGHGLTKTDARAPHSTHQGHKNTGSCDYLHQSDRVFSLWPPITHVSSVTKSLKPAQMYPLLSFPQWHRGVTLYEPDLRRSRSLLLL